MTLAVQQQMKIRRPVAEVFDALVNPEKLSGYFTTSSSGPLQANATVEWCWADYECGARLTVRVERFEQNRCVAFYWPATGQDTLVEFSFEAVTDSITRVEITETGWKMGESGAQSAMEQTGGWVHMLTCMKAWLEYDGINLREGMG